MKRLGIFSFYDKDGVVDSYIEYLLDELLTVLDQLIITVNGQVSEEGKSIFSRYSDNLVLRENAGFDAGAYADVIVNVLGDRIKEWDQIVLCNDTFFGPFVPMKVIFEKMDRKEVDFWGLNAVETKMFAHIQSYFLVFNSRVIQDGMLIQYFRTNIAPNADQVAEVHAKFERGLFQNLVEKGYTHGAYCNTELCCVYESPDMCLQQYGLPILKKKAFSEQYRNTGAAVNAIRYLRYNTNYDISHIRRCVQRIYDLKLGQEILSEYKPPNPEDIIHLECCRYTRAELDAHIGNRDFYIYGTGSYGRSIFNEILYQHKGLKGFVVSNTEKIDKPLLYGLPVVHYNEIDKNCLVVLGVGKRLTKLIKVQLCEETEYIELWE